MRTLSEDGRRLVEEGITTIEEVLSVTTVHEMESGEIKPAHPTSAANGTEVALGQLESELVALKQQRPEIAVVIRSHKELPVQKLIDLMDVVQKAKITRIGVITNPEN